jgi:hypothetical protein
MFYHNIIYKKTRINVLMASFISDCEIAPGKFLDIVGQDPNDSKSSRFMFTSSNLLHSFEEVNSIGSSKTIDN